MKIEINLGLSNNYEIIEIDVNHMSLDEAKLLFENIKTTKYFCCLKDYSEQYGVLTYLDNQDKLEEI